MPKKDYRRQKSRSFRSSSSGSFSWVVFGILIGLFAAFAFYWNQAVGPEHQVPKTNTSMSASAHASRQVETLPKKAAKTTTTPEFDFYTVLPKTEGGASDVTSSNAVSSTPASTLTTPSTSSVSPSSPTATSTSVNATATTAAVSPTASTSPTTSAPQRGTPATPAPTTAATATKSTTTTTAPVVLLPPESAPKTKVSSPSPANTVISESPTPAETPANKEVKTSSTKNATATNYLLQMGSLKNYADADRLKAQLTMQGFDVYIQPYTMNGQVRNRVVMGPYSSKTAALEQQAALQQSKISSVLISSP